ncbi:MAG: BREX system P-loop protein BrxC [Sulfobacillus thermotolerans]|nr:BREX system P-loop protein BrxC [Sulfobacillus thermotolerans]
MADTIRSLFQKDIHRNINGVVQAGQVDDGSVYEELTEYVVTAEIADALKLVLKNYVGSFTSPTNKMGVWVSGFFGSGKSHFLKILSYILANRTVRGRAATEYLRDKGIESSLSALLDAVNQAKTVPLLFNIDSESNTAGHRGQAIVDVLLKVFNRHLGYSSELWIAEIERQLAQAGQYQAFCQAFERIKGKSWQETREFLPMNRTPFLAAAESMGMSRDDADFLLRSTQNGFQMSSERFASLVAEYCRDKGPDFHLVFLIDEVGQYIAGDSRLMLNLQTVVEDIGVATRGQVWIMVTSQEQIETITNVKTEDFSKIQGRFATRINLSSINTDEVIKERLLAKQDWARKSLASQYDQVEQSLRNVLTFGTDTPGYRPGYRTQEEFIASYPCVPYQFDLLQDVFEKIRVQGEAGKHLAHGERSLLNAFQEAVDALGDEPMGHLVPMSAFYETIESFLDSSIKNTIRRAMLQHETLTSRDVAVLKVLYLIKHIAGMPATVDNVTTLLIDRVDIVKAGLAREVQESLNRLTHEQLIQQNANLTYTFLSDEEQEVNREILHTHVEAGELEQKLGELVFYKILDGQDKYRRGNRDFSYVRRFEGRSYGAATADLTVHFFMDTLSTEQRVKFLSLENPGTLYGLIPPGDYVESRTRAIKIDRYTRNALATTKDANRLRILQQKQLEAPAFIDQAESELRQALDRVTFYIVGHSVQGQGNFTSQLHEALDKLVQNAYPQLDYITAPLDPKKARDQISTWAKTGRPASTVGVNDLALDSVIRYLEQQQKLFTRVSMKELRDVFSRPPYGWADVDIAGLVAILLGMQRIRLAYNMVPLMADDPQLPDRLVKSSDQPKVIVDLIVAMPASERTQVARMLHEHFGYMDDLEDSYDAVGTVIRAQLETKVLTPLRDVKVIKQKENPVYPYPGASTIAMVEGDLASLPKDRAGQDLVQAFINNAARWPDVVERIEKLTGFYFKTPRERFDEAVHVVTNMAADISLATEYPVVQSLQHSIKGVLHAEEPYMQIPSLPKLCGDLRTALDEAVVEEKSRHAGEIHRATNDVMQIRAEHPALPDEVERLADAVLATVNAYNAATTLSLVLANLTQVGQRLGDLHRAVKALGQRPQGPHMIPFQQVLRRTAVGRAPRQITSPRELDMYLEEIQRQCLEILQSEGIIVIDVTED